MGRQAPLAEPQRSYAHPPTPSVTKTLTKLCCLCLCVSCARLHSLLQPIQAYSQKLLRSLCFSAAMLDSYRTEITSDGLSLAFSLHSCLPGVNFAYKIEWVEKTSSKWVRTARFQSRTWQGGDVSTRIQGLCPCPACGLLELCPKEPCSSIL